MAGKRSGWVVVLLLTAGSAATGMASTAGGTSNYARTVERAVALLPTRPAQVFVIDVNDAKPEDRD